MWITVLVIAAALSSVQMTKYKKQKRVLPREMREQWCYVPAGQAVLQQDTQLVADFYMATIEVSNQQYKSFLLSMQGQEELLQKHRLDSMVWVRAFTFGEAYKQHYHAHPAYANYPVVGIDVESAEAYCQWLQKEVQKELGAAYEVQCKLPNRYEWIRAARGDQHTFVYAWGGPYIANAKGQVLCNYRGVGDQSISIPIGEKKAEVIGQNYLGVAGYLSDNADILAPGFAYAPSVFGCKNMNGNAAELLEGGQGVAGGSWRNTGYDVRCESIMPFAGPVCHVGFRPMLRISPKVAAL